MTAGLDSPALAPTAQQEELRSDPITLEGWGWSSQPESCAPKIAALAALFNLAPPDPVARVTYTSRGNLLVIAGDAPERARAFAETLGSRLNVTLVAEAPRPIANCAAWSGEVVALDGYLGEFTATIERLRVGEGVAAAAATPAKFDLVLDFSAASRFAMRQPPQGYFHAPADDAALQALLPEIGQAVGEFEKPRYFAYRENICAHSRSQVVGCNACIEICSTQAIHPKGDHVEVDPHLCMGCGACATVCPSGAMTYQWPRVADRGAQLKQLLTTYRNAGGANPAIVFHDGRQARELLARAASEGHGLPARMLPLEAWHVASIGLDLLLPAVAFGATQVVLIASPDEDAEYVAALREQMAIGHAVLASLGYAGQHFAVVQAGDPAALEQQLAAFEPAAIPAVHATFLLGNDKRTAIEFAVEHLVRHAPHRVDEIALPEGSPFGEIRVAKDKCTMCMACVGACPESALMDGVDVPLLKFLERNCVQCGLCANTCPEDAISLYPRLLLTPAVREARVINETQPFHCIKCQKAFGTRQMVEAMMGRLATHKMFTGGDALKRLQMCADCRVVDMMSAKNEVSVLRLGDTA
jgi:ferredoxin